MYALKSANDEALLGLIEDHDEPVLGKCTTWVNERRAKPWIRPSVGWKFNGRGTESAFKFIAPILIAQLYWQTQIVITVLLNRLTKRPRETFFCFSEYLNDITVALNQPNNSGFTLRWNISIFISIIFFFLSYLSFSLFLSIYLSRFPSRWFGVFKMFDLFSN